MKAYINMWFITLVMVILNVGTILVLMMLVGNANRELKEIYEYVVEESSYNDDSENLNTDKYEVRIYRKDKKKDE